MATDPTSGVSLGASATLAAELCGNQPGPADEAIPPEEVIALTCQRLPDVLIKASWGETALFYNPGALLPNGVYFCTIKQHDSKHDVSSALDREGVYRLAMGLNPATYRRLFGDKPARPPQGHTVATGHDFSRIGELMPHPVYAWMYWAQILSPGRQCFRDIFPLIAEAHQMAMDKFGKKRLDLPRHG